MDSTPVQAHVTHKQMYYESRLPILCMEIQEKIAIRIKDIRLLKKYTQEELAWRSEVDRTFMNHVENGRRNISIKTLEKIVTAGLSMSLTEFFNDKIFNPKL